MNKILRKIRKTFYLNQIRPGPRFGRLRLELDDLEYLPMKSWALLQEPCPCPFVGKMKPYRRYNQQRRTQQHEKQCHPEIEKTFKKMLIHPLYPFNFRNSCAHYFTGSKKVSGLFGLKISLQYITVTKSSVSERLMILCV